MEVKFTDENFEAEALQSEMPVMVDFFAEWCGPCKMMGPAVEEMAGKYDGKVKIGKMNVDENQDTAIKYGIMSIPTVVLFKGGQEINRLNGLQSKNQLAEALDALL